ncbi:MAG: SDR family NAD(P)-dependent oxidoreductase, partial [Cyanobacteria bacterium J06638_38]
MMQKLGMQSEKKQILVVGASRGIGAAVAKHFEQKGDRVFSVSRSQPVAGEWIQADISTSEGITLVADTLGESVLDAFLFMGGVWENEAFTEQYDFFKS